MGTWRNPIRGLLGFALLLVFAPAVTGKIIYVDCHAKGTNTGTSWANAFTNLSAAFDEADPNDEIRVAQGVYTPAPPGGARTESFELRKANGARIRGGYAGASAPSARDVKTHPTILSGDLKGNDKPINGPDLQHNGENCYHVVTAVGVDKLTVLEGFTIRGGNANGESPEQKNGGGMYNQEATLKIVDCNFVGNFSQNNGGGMFNTANSTPRLEGCRFFANRAKYGGAIHNLDSRSLLIHCTFLANQADSHGGGIYDSNSPVELIASSFYANVAGSGGGIFNYVSDSNLVNCLFSGNSATWGWGGGLYNYNNHPRLTNCTFSRNSAGYGGGLYNVEAACVLTNCILWGNSSAEGKDEEAQIQMAKGKLAVNYCCIQSWTGQWPGAGNTYQDPLFVDDDGRDARAGTEDDDLCLRRRSPCIDKGDNNALPRDSFDLDGDKNLAEPIPFDYAGNPRVSNNVADLGAIEFQEGLAPGPVIYVNAHARVAGDGRSWITALASLQKALEIAAEYEGVQQIWVAGGVYTPTDVNGPREATFQLLNNVAIYGGFAGSETKLEERDPNCHVTILSGDLRSNDANVVDPQDLLAEPTRADNSLHVVTGTGTDATAVLDGFTITAGIADRQYNEEGGGAYIMAGSPTIERCTFQGNGARGNGGGLYCIFSNPTIRHCTIYRNGAGLDAESAGLGGGIYCDTSSPVIQDNVIADNCVIGYGAGITCDNRSAPRVEHNTLRDNRALGEGSEGGGIACLAKSTPRILRNRIIRNAAYDGGGIYCDDASPSILNNMIIANTAADDGGGICAIAKARPMIRNNTIVRNRAHPQGGGIYCENSHATILYCILWDNGDDFQNWTPANDCNPTYSCIQDQEDDAGVGNISFYPHFVDPGHDDYHLKAYSPCIDAAPPASALLVADELDFDGDSRGNSLPIDMGADETLFEKQTFDTDHDGLPDAWEIEHFGGLQFTKEDDPDNDGYSNLIEYQWGAPPGVAQRHDLYVSDATPDDAQADGSPEHPLASIQTAIDRAVEGGQIRVTEGIFRERLTIDGKILFIQGGYSRDFTRVAGRTTLNAEKKGRGVLYINVPDGLLAGFVISRGYERDGGGIYLFNSSPTIRDNEIRENYAIDDGGGISFYYRCHGLFANNVVTANNASANAGGIYCRESAPRIEHCAITNNEAGNGGGAMRVRGDSDPNLTNCVITGNTAGKEGGAILCREPRPEEDDPGVPTIQISGCTIRDNRSKGQNGRGGLVLRRALHPTPGDSIHATIRDSTIAGNTTPDLWASWSTVQIEGFVEIQDSHWWMKDVNAVGEGQVHMGSDAVLSMDHCSLQCNLTGPGSVEVELESELAIEGHAHINLAHPTDPQKNGTIQCDGLLHARGKAQITGAKINVTRASFENDVGIVNSVIQAQAGAPYGQFFVADTVMVKGSEIYADGDRYLDLDPSVFAGLIEEDNRIHVTITEGVGHTRGGLLELRGDPNLVPDANDSFLHRLTTAPAFGLRSWTLEELRLVDGAKVTLTNRFDFQSPYERGGSEEVLYVRNLVLGKGAVLNTAFNRVYYETLMGDPCAVVSVPLLGFSLNNIAFDDTSEFLTRIRHNNDPNRPHVLREVGRKPDPNDGVMLMRNLPDKDPDSPTSGQVIHARAKGLFAKSNENMIQIRFEYLFPEPFAGCELVVYLSDVPELLARDDPQHDAHYLEVSRLPQPPIGRPGAPGSNRWGIFEQVVAVGPMNFLRGTRIELELCGSAGASVLIDNWDPGIRCSSVCGDVVGGNEVNARDFLAILSECGQRTDAVITPGATGAGCLEGFFCDDGYVTVHDAIARDWMEVNKRNLCPDDLLEDGLTSVAPASHASTPLPPAQGISLAGASSPLDGLRGQFLVAAKRYLHRLGPYEVDDFLSDRLYGLDVKGNVVSGPLFLPQGQDRSNGKLVRDGSGALYQVNLTRGLVRLADNKPLVSPGNFWVDALAARVYIGLQNTPGTRPLLDAAFDAQGGFVYVVPVVVSPALGTPYVAAAKLQLDSPGPGPGYRLEQLFDDPPASGDNYVFTQLREMEVDGHGNVYVLNCHYRNSSDVLWVYLSNGQLLARRELQDLGISAPVGLCVSSHDPSKLYLASAVNRPDANTVNLYVLSTKDLSRLPEIEIHNMGHITDIAEDSATGMVGVVGFQMPVIPSALAMQDVAILNREPFYQPRFVAIPDNSSGPVEAVRPVGTVANSDMALPLSIIGVVPNETR